MKTKQLEQKIIERTINPYKTQCVLFLCTITKDLLWRASLYCSRAPYATHRKKLVKVYLFTKHIICNMSRIGYCLRANL